ncbi:DHA2 family efflux MFS transporter permease subunit [Porticoccaceae bacterium]|jgi:DHA2 family multidrug resistance protein|nr:DHA2 family efflux MFS transporter permease subunit [Porticoccaceae bacterium]
MSVTVKLSPRSKTAVTVAVMLAAIMQMLDTTIANVALPHMQGSLSATQDQLAWVLTSYIVAAAIMTLPIGWLSGRFGRKNVFVISTVGFTLASLLCGIATSLNEMIAFRILQGLFGASMVPLSQAIMLDINPKESHGRAMALWAVSVMIGPILGPTLGGFLTEYYSWRWVFYINLPFGAVVLFIVLTLMPETEREDRRFDALGFFALATFIACIQLILDRGHQLDWLDSMEIQLYCALVLSALWVYVIHTKTTTNPFLTGAIFNDRNFLTSLIFMFFIGLILLATMALLPTYLQNIMGFPIFDVGNILAPRGFGTMISMFILGKVADRFDPRGLVLFGLLLTAYSLALMCEFNTFVPARIIVITGIMQGFGLGFVFMPLSTLAYLTLDAKYRAEAAGLFSLVRNLGSSIGVSIAFSLFARNLQTQHAYLSENITPYSMAIGIQQLPQVLNNEATAALMLLDAEINRQAATIAYLNDFKLMMWVVLAMLPMVLLLRRPPTTSDNSVQA